jgi:hypothetical protein
MGEGMQRGNRRIICFDSLPGLNLGEECGKLEGAIF